MYERPINYQIQWASAGTPLVPSIEKIRNGWNGNEKPLVQHMNWILNRIDGAIGYFLQGAAEWGSEVDYPAGKLVAFEGGLYRSKLENKNKPISNTEYWEAAFFATTDGNSLAEEIRKIKEVDGYLTKYLTVSNPVTTARMVAGSYQASSGLGLSTSYNMGYSFDGYETTGMYLNGTTLTFRVGGVTRLLIPSAIPPTNDKTLNVATTEWVQRLIDEKIGNIDITANRLPIGSIFLSVNEQNPNATLGYGTWVRFSEGRVLVGKSTNLTDPEWTKTTYSQYGENKVVLEAGNTPAHRHYSVKASWGGYSDLNETNIVTTSAHRTEKDYKGYVAGGVPSSFEPEWGLTSNPIGTVNGVASGHNNVQPSLVVNIWRRTA